MSAVDGLFHFRAGRPGPGTTGTCPFGGGLPPPAPMRSGLIRGIVTVSAPLSLHFVHGEWACRASWQPRRTSPPPDMGRSGQQWRCQPRHVRTAERMSLDLVIRNGTVLDGTGADPSRATSRRGRPHRGVGGRGDRRPRARRARACRRPWLYRHPQPLRLHAARRPARSQRDPPGRDARGRRQLRLRLLPDRRPRASRARRSTATATPYRSSGARRRLLRAVEPARPAVNVLSLVPNGQLRLATVGLADRAADAASSRACRRCCASRSPRAHGATRPAWSTRRSRARPEDEITALCGALDGRSTRPTRARRDEGAVRVGRGGDPHRRARRGAAAGVAPRAAQRDRGGRAARSSWSSAPATAASTSSSTCTRAASGSRTSTRRCRRGRSAPDDLAALLARPRRARPHAPAPEPPQRRRRLVAHRPLRQPVLARVRAPRIAAIAAERGQDPLDAVYDLLVPAVEEPHKLMVIINAYDEQEQREAFAHPLLRARARTRRRSRPTARSPSRSSTARTPGRPGSGASWSTSSGCSHPARPCAS